ncbi:MAG: CusA/CzcA family heavy metal efflux RND transporter [Bryobacteraceae bacterium]|nr:CusA/CzcA family heavy metal efflux RND transporter [Bryobacteraceae bacterium]MDW8378367.1 CusA/CzcA family heavy metal efflux RND transporter [Bryobacterales bacterium]
MIAQLLRFALRQRLVTLLLACLLIVSGFWAALHLKLEAYPDISDTQVVVISLYPGRAAEEIEKQVTIPIERALNSVPGVIARRSRTIFGLSVVELTFDANTNDWFARQVVLERLRDADLPDGVTPVLGPMSTPIGELYRYKLQGPPGESSMRLRELQDWVVEPRFRQVPGVSDVTPFGGLVKQYQVQIDPAALTKYNLSIARVAEAIRANNSNAGGALLDNQQQAMVIRGIGLIQDIADIENIVISEAAGVPVFVKDVARVNIGAAPRTGIFAVGESTDDVEGIVLMRRGENPSEVLSSIKTAVEDLNHNLLPKDVRVVPIYDRTELVQQTLTTVSRTLAEGLAVVLVVVIFFLGSLRAAFLTAITIPLSLLFAFLCMYFSGIPANLLSLGALDFGIIVDGSLVMVEHILHTIETRRRFGSHRGNSLVEAVRDAALEMERPIFYSLLIIISAYFPLFTLQRVERKLFTPMAFTVCYALLGSLLFALTLVPVLATYVLHYGAGWNNPLLGWLERGYRKLLQVTVQNPRIVTALTAIIVLASALIGLQLGVEFLPTLDEGLIWVRANLPAGISLQKSAETAGVIRRIIAAHPEVALVSSQTGRNDAGTDPYGPNRNEFLVALKPYDRWPAGMNKAKLVEDLSQELQNSIPGAFFSFTQPIIDNVTEAVTGSAADLAVILRGPDLPTLRRYANQTLTLIRQVRGAADSAIEQEPEQPQVRISILRPAVARFGINVQDVQDVIEMAIGGRSVATVFEGERRFDIAVRYLPEARTNLNAIGNILVPTREGARVPLSQLATIEVSDGASIIARRDNQRQITVRTNIRGRDQGSFVAEAQKRFHDEIQLQPGYDVVWGGQFENLDRARKRMILILPLTIILIFGLLFFMFGSTLYAGLVLLNVPLSIVGGIFMLYLRGVNLSVSAAVGFISLFGVAVMSGVLIISEIRQVRHEFPELSATEAIVRGAVARFRGGLLMIFVALLGMVPAARATGIGSDVQRPLASVLVGGLISTLLLGFFCLPALCALTSKENKRRRT